MVIIVYLPWQFFSKASNPNANIHIFLKLQTDDLRNMFFVGSTCDGPRKTSYFSRGPFNSTYFRVKKTQLQYILTHVFLTSIYYGKFHDVTPFTTLEIGYRLPSCTDDLPAWQEPLPRQLPHSPVDVPPAIPRSVPPVLVPPVTEPTTLTATTELEPVTAMVETVKDPMSPEAKGGCNWRNKQHNLLGCPGQEVRING